MSNRADATGLTFWGDVDDDVALQRYRTLVDTIDDSVYQLDADGHFIAVNENIVDTTGYSRDELIGEHVSLVVDEADIERINRGIRTQLEGDGKLSPIELSIHTADSSRIPCELRINVLLDDGEFAGTIGVARDISDRKRQRETLESARASYDSITSVVDEADIGVFILDESFKVRWIDESIEEYLGLDRESVVGRDKRTVIEESVAERFADPDSFARNVLATYDDNSYVERFECRVTADSETGREERWLEHRSKPISSGQYAGGRVELYYDITDRKRSEGALQESEERFQSLVDAVEEYAIFRLDSDGHVASWNEGARQIKGYEREEILGSHVSTFYTDDDCRTNVPTETLERARNAGSIETEGWRVRKDGSRFWANVTITSVVDETGTHRGYVKVTRDMTDQREREQQLQRERDLIDRVFETSPVGIVVFDEDGAVTRANERYLEILELPASSLETYTQAGGTIHDATGETVSQGTHPFTRALRTGEPVLDRVLQLETPGADDRRWFVTNAVPILADDGTVDRVVATAEDVTALKERERELESELEAILNRITDAFYALDDDWTLTYVNDRAEELIDVEDRGLLGRNLWEVFEWAADSKLREEYERAMTTQEPTSFELYYPAPLETWFEIHAYPSETGLSVYFRDISDRKERERKLTESERRYRTLIEYFPNGIVTLFDHDRRYTLAAGKGFERIPATPSDLEGSHFRDAWNEEAAADALEPLFEAVLEEGEERSIELTYADREWVVRAVPITDERGDVFAGMTMAQDVTERNQHERALREERNLVERIVDTSPVGIVTLDADGDFDRVNRRAREILGYPEGEFEEVVADLEGLDPVEPDGESLSTPEIPPYRVFREGETIHDFEMGVRRAGGRRIWVSVSGTPLYDDGEIAGAVITFADVSERKEYQQRLEASNERLEQFAYAASHDLQEPLRMVSSYLQLIERRYADEFDDDAEEFLAYAVDGADRMRNMIEGLLEYSRVETKGEPLEPIDLEDVVDDVLGNLRLQIEETDAEIAVDDLPRVTGDGDQLRQVFQNLLSNAIEYSGDEPPAIDISAERAGPQWRIDVSDEGIGIDPDETGRIFEVFQRLHSRDEHPGTGIGLALCQRIVERHGGEILVDSEPGEGSTFTITLPAADDTDR
ncbi:PAS domain S-box protein [Natronorubrum texcoconense]|uniref:histidine kinase n=1 Tax=Natronorubrum texcoconense TaxID=1095776 RepID=A0A1G9E513_9EURY|nr:PAS domain S-box protein [Natronorubrum texcoconense]SDK71188.1 PAS domain S-box-containing protein [Natronorubrum texcoconense]